MKRIFISIPYTQVLYKEFDLYIKQIAEVARAIIANGDTPVCPVLVHHYAYTLLQTPEIEYEDWFQAAVSDLKTCDEMWVLKLPTWDTSSGVAREIQICQEELNIPVSLVEMPFTIRSVYEIRH